MKFGQVVGAGLLVAMLGVGGYGQQGKKEDEPKQQEKPKQEEKQKSQAELIQQWIRDLGSKDEAVQAKAVEELKKRGAEALTELERAIEELKRHSKFAEDKEGIHAWHDRAKKLADEIRAEWDAKIKKWLEQLNSENLAERKRGVEELKKIGEPAQEALEELIKEGKDGEAVARAKEVIKYIKERVIEEVASKSLRIKILEARFHQHKAAAGAGYALKIEMENLTDKEMTLSKPTLKAINLPEGWEVNPGNIRQWDGHLNAKEKKIIEFSEQGCIFESHENQLELIFKDSEGTKLVLRTEKQYVGTNESKCTCGCKRSEQMIEDLKRAAQKGRMGVAAALDRIHDSLKVIRFWEGRGELTARQIVHRERLLKLEAELKPTLKKYQGVVEREK